MAERRPAVADADERPGAPVQQAIVSPAIDALVLFSLTFTFALLAVVLL